jgi:hypothetical protein
VSFIGQHYLELICLGGVVGVTLIFRFAGQTNGK